MKISTPPISCKQNIQLRRIQDLRIDYLIKSEGPDAPYLYFSLKFGNREVIRQIAFRIARHLQEMIPPEKRSKCALVTRAEPCGVPPHGVEYLVEEVAKYLKLPVIRASDSQNLYFYQLSPDQRENIFQTLKVGLFLDGVPPEVDTLILIDDVVATGVNMKAFQSALGAQGDYHIIPYAVIDARNDVRFEAKMFNDFFWKSYPLSELRNCDFTRSFLKFLYRLIDSEEEEKLTKIIDNLTQDQLPELINKSLSFALVYPEFFPYLEPLFKTIDSRKWHLQNAGISELLPAVKRPSTTKHLPNATLYTRSNNWASPESLMLYAYWMGYDYVVLEERRKLPPSTLRRFVALAQMLGIGFTSPYFSTLSPQDYRAEDSIRNDYQVLDRFPALTVYRDRLSRLKRTYSSLDHPCFEDMQRYNQEFQQLLREVAEFAFRNLQHEFSQEDFLILMVGSGGRGELNLQSDIDILTITSEEKREMVSEFVFQFAQILKAVGVEMTPLNLLKDKLSRGEAIFSPLQEIDLPKFLRLLNAVPLLGNSKLLKEVKKNVQPSVFLSPFQKFIRDYWDIYTQGKGFPISSRDYRIWRSEQYYYDLKVGLRGFQYGIYYILLSRGVSLQELPPSPLETLELYVQLGLASGEEVEEVKNAYQRILVSQFYHSRSGNLYGRKPRSEIWDESFHRLYEFLSLFIKGAF